MNCFLILLLTPLTFATTLKEAYNAARANMETLKRADANIEGREETKNRARAALLPTINAVGNITRIDPPNNAGANPFLLTRQYAHAIRLSQPLIRGGVIGAYELANDSLLLSEFQKNASELTLYQLVINSYFGLANAQADVKNLQNFLKLSKERVAEIQQRTAIGRSRRGELVEAQAQLHAAESQHQQGLITLENTERSYRFFTNLEPAPIVLDSVPDLKATLEDYMARLKQRPDVLASTQQIKVAQSQIEVAKGGHYPQLDAVGNYYFERTGILATSKWDAALVYTVPLFQGGGVTAQVREAVANRRVAELNNHEFLRAAERDLTIQYRSVSQVILQLKALKEALSKAEEAYRLNRKDYSFGLVTNLDVLQSMNNYITTKRNYDALVVAGNQAFHNLESLAGVLP